MSNDLRDVLAVNLETFAVRLLATRRTPRDGDAIINMTVMRRGVGAEFFTTATAGLYVDGDIWKGDEP